jgi:hypothetical protein
MGLGFAQPGHQIPGGIDLSDTHAMKEESRPGILGQTGGPPEATLPIRPPFSGPEETEKEDRAGNQCPKSVEKIVPSLHFRLRSLPPLSQ